MKGVLKDLDMVLFVLLKHQSKHGGSYSKAEQFSFRVETDIDAISIDVLHLLLLDLSITVLDAQVVLLERIVDSRVKLVEELVLCAELFDQVEFKRDVSLLEHFEDASDLLGVKSEHVLLLHLFDPQLESVLCQELPAFPQLLLNFKQSSQS